MRANVSVVLAGALVAIMACARGQTIATAPSTLRPGDVRRSLHHDGLERSYLLHVPPGYDGMQPVTVVLVLHGGGGRAAGTARLTGFNALADRAGFLAVYPNGTGLLPDMFLTWNGGNCCGYAQRNAVDDIGFLRAVLADLRAIAPVDPRRVYATGLSNGAILCYRLACEASDLVAAIGPVAGTQNLARCTPAEPVSVIHFHGTDDTHAPYDGGRGPDSRAGVDFSSVAETIGFWVEANHCDPVPRTETFADIRHETYLGCAENSAVELYTILGGLHAWPGSAGPAWPGGDEPTRTISATEILWEFFNAHPKP